MKTIKTENEAFKGNKKQLSNITATKWTNSRGILIYLLGKGKGTGSTLLTTMSWDTVLKFDQHFKDLVVKPIFSNKDNRKGYGYFLGEELFNSEEHPFVKEGGYHL